MRWREDSGGEGGGGLMKGLGAEEGIKERERAD